MVDDEEAVEEIEVHARPILDVESRGRAEIEHHLGEHRARAAALVLHVEVEDHERARAQEQQHLG